LGLLQISILAIVQGITEFLPISSSGHLVIFSSFTDWSDQGLEFDVAVHIGTLGAVLLYFRKDIIKILIGIIKPKNSTARSGRALLIKILVSIPPVIIAGGLLAWLDPNLFRSIEVIAYTTLSFGILLWIADKLNISTNRVEKMPLSAPILIGLAQALAVIPGTSRSGITITAARMMGIERSNAAKFSMLISIPVILAAGALSAYKVSTTEHLIVISDLAIAMGISFVIALLAITLMMKFIRIVGFGPFALYRIALGGALLAIIYLD